MDDVPRIHALKRLAAAAAVVLALPGAAFALDSGRAVGGEPYLSGGIGQEEVAALQIARRQFSLGVRTALRGSGAYVADVQLRIVDAQGRQLFQQEAGGPWLLIDLAPGRYVVHASHRGQWQSRSVTIPARGSQEVVLHFDPAGEARDPVRADEASAHRASR